MANKSRHKLSLSEAAAEAGLRVIQRGGANASDAAALFKVTPQAISQRIRTGTLKAVRVGGMWWISLEELQRAGATLPPSSMLAAAYARFSLDPDVDDIEAYYD